YNVPTVSNVHITSNLSVNTTSRGNFKFLRNNGNWYAITTLITSKICVLELGNDFARDTLNAVVHDDPFGYLDQSAAVDFTVVDDSIFVVVLNDGGSLAIYNFGQDITAAPVSGIENGLLDSVF